jgi:hypothetical protein
MPLKKKKKKLLLPLLMVKKKLLLPLLKMEKKVKKNHLKNLFNMILLSKSLILMNL